MRDNSISTDKGKVYVFLQAIQETYLIPKLIELLTPKRTVMYQSWVTGRETELGYFTPRDYLLRVSLPSGIYFEKIVKVVKGDFNRFLFNLEMPTVPKGTEWAYFAKRSMPSSRAVRKYADSKLNSPLEVEIKMLTFRGEQWSSENLFSERRFTNSIDQTGQVFDLHTGNDFQMLEIRPNNYLPKYVRMPLDSSMKLLLREQVSNQEISHPIEVVASTTDWRIEALLQILKTGKMDLADELVSREEVRDMLRRKYDNVNAAAIAADYLYYSVKYEETKKWMENLANDFPKLPDGAIIRGAQLINRGNPSKAAIIESREMHLSAFQRGLPVYTLGFRMLREGLLKMNAHFKNDKELSEALQRIDYFHGIIDYTRDLTTLVPVVAPTPDEPLHDAYFTLPGTNQLLPIGYSHGISNSKKTKDFDSSPILVEQYESNI